MDVIIIYTAVFICLVWVDTTLVWAFFKLTRNLDSPQPLLLTAESLDEFSTDRYSPMLGLLTPQIPTKLRKQRCHLFQQFLRQMDNDFRRICTGLKLILVQSEQDRPDLAWGVLRKEMTFAHLRMKVQFKLIGYRYGLDA